MMARVKLAEEKRREQMVSRLVLPVLYADKCDGCGKVFAMEEFCNEEYRGKLRGTFEHSCAPHGNGFSAEVCSFHCAHVVFAERGWKNIDRYKDFAAHDINLVRAELVVTNYVLDEAQIRGEWAAQEKA